MRTPTQLPLAIALLMFPQLAQTLYSPALADFATMFSVPPEAASQALTVYFLAFAFGVVGWGLLCDRVGRRPAMLYGLALFTTASVTALSVETFGALLATQALAALGAAAGSVVTQTVLRDQFSGPALARTFSLVGMALAISPAIGLAVGMGLVQGFGYRGTMLGLAGLAAVLWAWTAAALPETRPAVRARNALAQTGRTMLADPFIWRSALLVAAFNIALFSYYSLGPFIFQRLHTALEWYGYSGVMLAAGASSGSWLNKRLLDTGHAPATLETLAAALLLGGVIAVHAMRDSVWFLAPMLAVVMAFGIAIPNVLGQALRAYGDRIGTAGAVFGLMYYLLIGAGMLLVGWTQALGGTLIVCGCTAIGLCGPRPRSLPTQPLQ